MTKTKRIRRIIVSAIAVLTLAVSLISFDAPTTTGNAASLKHIDEIVAESGTFNILEIVPDTGAASFGYYIDGQEPISSAAFDTYSDGTVQINGWKAALAKKTSPAERTTFVNDHFGRLASKGVLGNGTATPLRYTYLDGANYYTESYLVTDPQNWSVLQLQTTESVTMTGTFSELPDGGFRAEYTYSPASNGGYIQNISHFNYATEQTAGTYYYMPTFLPITPGMDLTDTETMKWSTTAVYIELKDVNGNMKDLSGNNIYTVGQYKTVKEILDNGGFDQAVRYYYVDPAQTGAPGAYSGTNYYAAAVSSNDSDDAPGDGYLSTAGASYFSRSISSYTHVGTGGNYSFTADTNGLPHTVNFKNVYYKAGFVNNNLFKQYVFGLVDPANNPNHEPDYNALNVTVTVRKAGQVTASDISNAGMVYISSGTDITMNGVTTGYAAEDIPDARAVDLYNYAADQNPVIMDYPIIQGITQTTPADQINNIEKLCLLSLQSETAPSSETSLSGLTVNWSNLAYVTSDADKTFVNNNIYCFDAFNTVSTATIPNLVTPGPSDIITVVSALYNQSYSSNVYSSGFSAVLAEIQNENFLKQIAGETNLLPENVTVSASVRHIINFKGQRQTNPKTSIKVLDLEPAKVTSASTSYLTPSTVRSWINNTLPTDKITIVHMTTAEFIGKIEDINETYDMIYIGMSTETLNTSGGTVYNDSTMNGLIYSNIGDIYKASLELAGIRAQDYVTVGGTKAINGRNGTTANQFRFSGNDITAAKVSELEKYAQAGYPVILANGFVSGSAVNAAKVDSSSYMYEAISNIYGTYNNVMTQSYAANSSNADTVIKYLNVSKPTVNMTSKPVEYADDGNSSIAVDPNDGYYYLKYVFSISNVTDPTPVTTTYNCRVFIDLNADGRYSDNEGLDDIEVHRVSDGALMLPQPDGNEIERYALSADIEYQVTRQMPNSYVGIIPWKLEVIKNNADQIHASTQGYTHIAPGSKVQTIKVLQIMQTGTSGTKLNLAQQLTENAAGTNPQQLEGRDNKVYTGIYGKLIADLMDFQVTIDTIETNALEAKGNEATIRNYLSGYDMLIIGFNDCYDGIQINSADAIVNYINSGKSVLFTHDTTSLSQVPASNFPMAVSGTSTLSTIPSNISDWGYFFNTRIRDAVGLDRYGVTSLTQTDGGQTLGSYVNDYASMTQAEIDLVKAYNRGIAFTPKSGKGSTVNEFQGYTNYALIRFAASSGNTYKYTKNIYTNRETTNVSQVNKGQITTYPYNVNSAVFGGNDPTITGYGGSYMKIGKTHEQYFQINMNTDDIVVWYCMSSGGTDNDSYYDDVPNDCVNAYYIYNKGNVTYSGVGHSSNASLYSGSAISQEYINEAKLFVNTMIAAYQSTAQAPKITIKKDARGTSDVSEKYMLTDETSVLSMDLGPTDESRAVYYRISDPNVGVSKTITVQYYVSDDAGTIDPTVDADQKISPLGSIATYNTNGTAVTTVKGGYVYKFYLMDKAGEVEVLDQLNHSDVYSIKIYIKVTTMIGSTPLTPTVDSIEIKKQQLFELS